MFHNKKLQSILDGLSVHLVEVSPAMADIQATTIQATPSHLSASPASSTQDADGEVIGYKSGRVAGGRVSVTWHKQLEDIPQGLILSLHEVS